MLSTYFAKGGVAVTSKRLNTLAKNEPSWTPLVCVSGVYTLGAGLAYPDIFWHMVFLTASEMLAFSLAFLALALCVEGLLKSPQRPLEQVIGKLRERGRLIACGLALFILGVSAYSTYKVHIPDVVPFYADPYLADIDRLFYGRDAWHAFHEIPPQAGLVIDFFYTRVWPGVLLLGVLSALLFVDGRMLLRYAWSLFFVYAVLGTVLATVFSSVGPIFYTDFYPGTQQFLHLKPAIQGNPYISDLNNYANYLLDAYRTKQLTFAAGISAFPSVHVAIATLSAWFLTGYGRGWAVLGWTQAVIIQYGSIYSGWHYAIDGDVSLIAVTAFWFLLSRIYGLPLMPASRAERAQRDQTGIGLS